jgi:hypothetical protein
MRVVAAAVLLFAFAGSAQAVEWRLGLSYASGVSDVADLYEDNLRLDGREANVDLKFPVGVAASFVYDWTTEWRTDVGVGPVFAIGGDRFRPRSATNSCRIRAIRLMFAAA